MSEQHKAIVRRFVEEVQNSGNIDAAGEFIAEDFLDHSAPPAYHRAWKARRRSSP